MDTHIPHTTILIVIVRISIPARVSRYYHIPHITMATMHMHIPHMNTVTGLFMKETHNMIMSIQIETHHVHGPRTS